MCRPCLLLFTTTWQMLRSQVVLHKDIVEGDAARSSLRAGGHPLTAACGVPLLLGLGC